MEIAKKTQHNNQPVIGNVWDRPRPAGGHGSGPLRPRLEFHWGGSVGLPLGWKCRHVATRHHFFSRHAKWHDISYWWYIVVCMPYITRRTFFTARPPKRYGVILSITLLTALFFHEHAHKNTRFHTKFHPRDNHPIVLVVAISNLNDTLSPANKTSNYPVDGLDSVQIQ